jgi:hypothetical protein
MEPAGEITPLTIIRTETALSRFPTHRLVKRGDVQIEIKNQAAALLWEVTHNSKYGQPGPLAYKLDTLIVNRRIEEAGRPVPKLIRLGSLRDICRELGNSEGGESTLAVRKALLQNAFAGITAKITYRAVDQTERTLEAAFTRYAVIFTGETLPDGAAADGVYLVLNDVYLEVLNAAITRPLDYDYMRALPPAAQRFYEIVSYQIYGALLHKNERARLRYSEYCLLSTATRYFDFDHVKKQMYKVHRPHLTSGYLAKVAFDQTVDANGQPDWFMYYVPGPNASREYKEFTGNAHRGGKGLRGRGGRGAPRGPQEQPAARSLLLPFPEAELVVTGEAVKAATAEAEGNRPSDPEAQALFETLAAVGMNRTDAERLAKAKPDECQRQLSYLPFKGDVENPGAYLRKAIEGGFAAPKAYVAAQAKAERERQKQAEAERRQAAEATKIAAEAAEAARLTESLSRLEIDAPAAFTGFLRFVEARKAALAAQYAKLPKGIGARRVARLDTDEGRLELFREWEGLSDEARASFLLPAAGTHAATHP